MHFLLDKWENNFYFLGCREGLVTMSVSYYALLMAISCSAKALDLVQNIPIIIKLISVLQCEQ